MFLLSSMSLSSLSQGAGEILGDILDAMSQAAPPQEQDKRESLEDLQRQFEELFLWPSPSSCCPPVRATRLLPSPPFPSSLFPWRPEPTRPASASLLCPRSSVSCGLARSRDLYSSDCLQFFAYSCSKIAKYKVEIVDTTLGNGF